jgi:hypothetical protein
MCGPELIPLLMRRKDLDVAAKNAKNRDALALAIQKGPRMASVLLPLLPPDKRKPSHYSCDVPDPLASIQAWKLTESAPEPSFGRWVRNKASSSSSWAALRCGVAPCLNLSNNDWFAALRGCNQVTLWIWASREPWFQQHPMTGETVMHLLARTDALTTEQKLQVLSELKRDFRNPLILNFNKELAVDVASDPVLKIELRKYMQFRPNRYCACFVFCIVFQTLLDLSCVGLDRSF